MRFVAAAFAIGLVTWPLCAPPAGAQDAYPSKPVRVIVSLPVGSSPDIRTRIVANQLTAIWRQQVVVENRPGAGGALSVQAALSAPPDGHTLLAAASSLFTVLPAQKDKLPFDIKRDLIPVATITSEGMVVAVSSKLGVGSLAEFVTLAKANPDKYAIGTNPAGSLPHLAARLLVSATGAPITVVPFSSGGTNEAVRETLGGRIHGVVETRPALQGHLASGDLKALAIMTPERVPTVPDLPTAVETVPGVTAIGWAGIFAPRGTPDSVVQSLSQSLRLALDSPEVKARFEQTGSPLRPLFTADLARFIETEQQLWWPIVKATE